MLYTSGHGLDEQRARSLYGAGLVACHVSLDHPDAQRHDAGRGRLGSAKEAHAAITASRRAGLHTAVRTIIDPDLLLPGRMRCHLDLCRRLGAHEVILIDEVRVRSCQPQSSLPPSAMRILRSWQRRSAWNATLPVVTPMPIIEGPDAFGCQAGFSFFYVAVDGGVWPCDLVPRPVGNVMSDSLETIRQRLKSLFPRPCQECLGRISHIPNEL